MQREIRHGITAALGLLLLALLGSPSLSQPTAPATSKDVIVDGSSTVGPITQAVAAEFVKIRPDVKVSVGVSGTSGGFRRFLAKETDISNASRPIKSSEIESAAQNALGYVETLVALDGLTVAVDRETQVFQGGVPCMTVGELELLWSREAEGFITQWSQLGSRFIHASITLSGAAETSGTFDFFTEAINEATGDTRSDYFGTEEDQLLAEQTGQNPLALTYFGFAFFVSNQGLVQAVAIDPRRELIDTPESVVNEINQRRAANHKKPLEVKGGACQGVLPSLDAILTFQYQPLSRPLFIYTNLQSAQREAVDAFVDFYLQEDLFGNEEFMQDVGYVNVPFELREAARQCWDQRVSGTAFAGTISGLTGEEITQRYKNHCGL
jgi:phosphate transport system substrate-binding protein